MYFNQLNVYPTPETLDYFSSVLSGSPLDLDLQAFSIEVTLSADDIEAEPDRQYQVMPTGLRIWYDSHIQQSSLILSLTSPDLLQRAKELVEQGVLREWHDYYFPYLVIRPGMPSLSSNYKRFVVSAANALMSNSGQTPLIFSQETVQAVVLDAPANQDYYNAMLEDATKRHNI